VAFDDEPWIRKGRGGTRYMLGYAVAGRYLFVVYLLKGKGIARVIMQWIWTRRQGRCTRKGASDEETSRI
jgi:hypothetical protein